MQPRRFRPGDVVDDYCPRERRITDHAIVAMIEDDIKQTRCVVCDSEHAYKQARVPPQRRKKAQAGLFSQVLDALKGPPGTRAGQGDAAEDVVLPTPAGRRRDAAPSAAELATSGNGRGLTMPGVTSTFAGDAEAPGGAPPGDGGPLRSGPPADAGPPGGRGATEPTDRQGDDGSIRRMLIRATLPRPEGQPPASRTVPEFTMRQPGNSRGGHRGGRRRRRAGHHHPGLTGGPGGGFDRGGHLARQGVRGPGAHGGRARHRRGKKR
jgi:hypothetical protein